MVFARSSHRPPGEAQVAWPYGPRQSAGCTLRTQYLRIGDTGSCATFLSSPTWMWGAEHGVNEFGVAIGAARAAVTNVASSPPTLIAPDLVRLGLERAHHAAQAAEVIIGLIEGIGGPGSIDRPEGIDTGAASRPSFLIADPSAAYVLEPEGVDWVATAVPDGTGIADGTGRAREYPTTAEEGGLTAAAAAAHLRRHSDPIRSGADGQVTAAAMVADLPDALEDGAPLLTYVAVGTPLTSVFVPAFPRTASGPPPCIPIELSGTELWEAADAVRKIVADRPDVLAEVRDALGAVEDELWAEADSVRHAPERWAATGGSWGARALEALRSCIPSPG